MKRDWTLIKHLMGVLEENQELYFNSSSVAIGREKDWSSRQILYHLQLMKDAEWIVCQVVTDMTGDLQIYVERITFEGQEFLSLSRQPQWDEINFEGKPWELIKALLLLQQPVQP